MTYDEARAINTDHRKRGTAALSPAERLLAKEASDVMHKYSMENDSSYARQFRAAYNSLAAAVRPELVGTR